VARERGLSSTEAAVLVGTAEAALGTADNEWNWSSKVKDSAILPDYETRASS